MENQNYFDENEFLMGIWENEDVFDENESSKGIDGEELKKFFGIPFSEEQIQVVSRNDPSPLTVISGAGSGKTSVVIANMQAKIHYHGVNPSNILSLTFSKKASTDVAKRYTKLIRDRKDKSMASLPYPTFRTFHSLFYQLLNSYNNVRLETLDNPGIYLFKLTNLVTDFGDTSKSDTVNEMFSVRGNLINQMVTKDGITDVDFDGMDIKFDPNDYFKVMKKYEELKKTDRKIDFEDMQILLLQLLETNIGEKIRTDFRDRFKHIYLDEYQDINPLQKTILDDLMNNDFSNFITIGDDDQCIYSFRGSEPKYIKNFKYNYVGAKALYLSNNFRCKSNILNPIISSIERNEDRLDKKLIPFFEGGEVFSLPEYSLADLISNALKIKENLKDTEIEDYKNTCILVRQNYQKMIIVDSLIEAGVQVNIGNIKGSLHYNSTYIILLEMIRMVKERDNELFFKHTNKVLPHIRGSVEERIITTTGDWFETVVEDNEYNLSEKSRNILLNMERELETSKLIKLAWKILHPYYVKIAEKGYVNLNKITEVVTYLTYIGKGIGFDDFQVFEESKQNLLSLCSENSLGIQVNTFHGSKGLEYDTVILAGVNNSVVPNVGRMNELVTKGNVESAIKEFEEERRLFYVAWTRAENKLYVNYKTSDKSIFLSEVSGVDLEAVPYLEKTHLTDILSPKNKEKYFKYMESIQKEVV